MLPGHVKIIAEAGVNHNGNIDLAKKLIDVAVDAGADIVKFQTFRSGKLVTKQARKADYQKKNLGGNSDTQFEMLKALELSENDHVLLKKYCGQRHIGFLSTPFDTDSIDFLTGLGMTTGKIPSGELTNLPYLRKMAKSFKEIILSTGMATMNEIGEAMHVLQKEDVSPGMITILHCNTEYPTPMEDVNLKAMIALRDEFHTPVGYSDHTLGIEVPIAAVALGATVIEKHFTLDKKMKGPDHGASLEPGELKSMVLAIRNIEKVMAGSGIKEPSPSEMKNITIARKSIVAAVPIRAGELFTEINIAVKRPAGGISPMKWDEVIGTKAKRDYLEDEMIEI